MKCIIMYNDNERLVVEDGQNLDAILKKIEDDNDKSRREFWRMRRRHSYYFSGGKND